MKKKLFIAAAAVFLAIFVALPPGECAAANGILVIDSVHLYEGMDKTYSQGYKPALSDSAVSICLPLVVSEVYGETIPEGEITVYADVGSGDESPFVPGDYEKAVSLEYLEVPGDSGGTASVSAYVVRLDLPLKTATANGRYPVVVHATYVNGAGESVRQSFTVFAAITNGEQSAPASNPPVLDDGMPRLIISGYSVSPLAVLAGTVFEVDFTLRNTSGSQAARDIVVTYAGKTGDLMPEGDANTFFVSKIDKASEQTFHIKMQAEGDAKTSVNRIAFSIIYLDENGDERTALGEVPVLIKQPVRIRFEDPALPESVYTGEVLTVTLAIHNDGKSALYNLTAALEVEELVPEGASYLGNLEAGESKTAEMHATTADRPGEVQGNILVSYEDESGDKFSEKVPFKSEILPRFLGAAVDRGVLWLVFGIAGAAVAAYFILKYRVPAQRKKSGGT